MELEDIDRKRQLITVRLKGARDQHRVPVTDDFWPIYEKYLRSERRASPDVYAVWIASRKGQGKPLRYATFESALRYIGRKAGISAHPHLFRHTLAQGILDTTGNIKVAQEILRAFTSKHDSRSVPARRSASNGHCVGEGKVQHWASQKAPLVAIS